MNKAFEKIIEKLEEEKMSYFLTIANTGDEKLDCAYEHTGDALDKAIEIVKQEAERYNNGWIPCSVDLPKEKDGIVLICCEDGNVMTGKRSEFSDTWYKGNMYAVGGSNVIAWQPLPQPFQNGE